MFLMVSDEINYEHNQTKHLLRKKKMRKRLENRVMSSTQHRFCAHTYIFTALNESKLDKNAIRTERNFYNWKW